MPSSPASGPRVCAAGEPIPSFTRRSSRSGGHLGLHVRALGAEQAQEYLRELQRAAANPRIGGACDEIRPGYLKLGAGSHTLFYRVTAEGVIDVVRVLHQRMDVDRHP